MNLLGEWDIDETDVRALVDLGRVSLEFGENGVLTYRIHGREKDEIIILQYRIDGSAILTDQPSARGVERTEFSLVDDVLTLTFSGKSYRFLRNV